MRVLLLPLGAGTWCLPLDAVREVLVTPRTTPLPTGPPDVVGLFNLRGDVLPLFDTAGLLSLPSVPSLHVAVVEVTAGLAGLVSSGTPRAARLGRLVGAPEHPAALGTYTVEAALQGPGTDAGARLARGADDRPGAEAQPARGEEAAPVRSGEVAVLLDVERLLA